MLERIYLILAIILLFVMGALAFISVCYWHNTLVFFIVLIGMLVWTDFAFTDNNRKTKILQS